ncbi:MAG TPA: glycosyltransferase [Candidatus Paceibacterota bacterium]|nr:glycosyltransferase [Candidatus Paceibacterota bacterium]
MRILFVHRNNHYPQDRHLIDGLRELGHDVFELKLASNKGAIRAIRRESKDVDFIFIGFTAPLLAIAARIARPRATIVFNAVLSQYEANIVSRGEYGFLGMRALKWRVIDSLSFAASSKVLLESDAQINFIREEFAVPGRKLIRSLSGLDERDFFFDSRVPKHSRFSVLFRGRFLPESGIDTVIRTAKILENEGVDFLIIGHGFLYKTVNALMAELAPKNVTKIEETLPIDELRRKMLSCHVSLGQVADHPRLRRTLPCKLFESLALKLPYLSGRNQAVLEVLTENVNCVMANPGDAEDLAAKIRLLRDSPALREKIARAGHDLYRHTLTSKALAKEVMDELLLESGDE